MDTLDDVMTVGGGELDVVVEGLRGMTVCVCVLKVMRLADSVDETRSGAEDVEDGLESEVGNDDTSLEGAALEAAAVLLTTGRLDAAPRLADVAVEAADEYQPLLAPV